MSFTKDFHTSLEAIMRDPLATVGERVMAWLKRCAWGNYSFYAILPGKEGRPDRPRYQCDCSRELGIDKRQVSNAIRYFKKRGYVRVQGKLLYPVVSPVVSGLKVITSSDSPGRDTPSSDFQTFMDEWKVAKASDFQELEAARATVERLRKVILHDYKKWRAPATYGPPILIEDSEIKIEEGIPASRVVDISAPPPPDRPSSENGSVVETEPLKAKIRSWLVATFPLPLPPDDAVLEPIAKHCADDAGFAQFQEACSGIKSPRTWMYFLPIAERCAAHRADYRKAKAGADPPRGSREWMLKQMEEKEERRKSWPTF